MRKAIAILGALASTVIAVVVLDGAGSPLAFTLPFAALIGLVVFVYADTGD